MRREHPLPGDARRLIAENVDSVGALDLLLLVRDHPERWRMRMRHGLARAPG